MIQRFRSFGLGLALSALGSLSFLAGPGCTGALASEPPGQPGQVTAQQAAQQATHPVAEPMILTVTLAGADMERAAAALHQAVTSHNYTFVRQQAIDSRLVPYAQEVRSVRLYYFCNFDKMDRALLLTIIDKFAGGPVGIETLAAAVGEERDTIEDVYEPFLIQEGFLARTPKGRTATALAYEHFGRRVGVQTPAQQKLL